MRDTKLALLVALVLAGCTVSVTAPPGAGKAPAVKAKASAKPAAPRATMGPPVAAPSSSPSTAVPLVTAAGSPLVFPTKVLPPLPASLIAAGAGNLVGPDGASLVGPDGASLIGMDGASLIGADGASLSGAPGVGYRLAQVEVPSPVPSPSATPEGGCPPPRVPTAPGGLIALELQDFLQNTKGIEDMLAEASALALVPGTPQTHASKGMGGQDEPLTYLVERRGDGGVLRVARGATITPDNQMVVLSFTSANAGELLYRLKLEKLNMDLGLKVKFDLAKGESSSDFLMKMALFPGLPPTVGRRQVSVTRLAGGAPTAPTMRLAASSVTNTGLPCRDSRTMLAIHYLEDGRAAMQFGVTRAKGAPLEFMSIEGVRAPEVGPTTGFFVDKDGIYLSGDATLRELGPAMPTKDQMPASLPPDPDPTDPFSDPTFQPMP